jgi:glycosyltransferase involved in cell wall biosynthesis
MSNSQLSISIVIPTLNRASYISKLIKSIVDQSLLPDQLVVVDQNNNDITKDTVEKLIHPHKEISLAYIHDSSFNSLVQAKDIGAKNATCDIVCFLDDDVILDKEYLSQIKSGFIQEKSEALGCMGYITNGTRKSKLYLLAHKFFFQGIFTDQRPAILSNITESSPLLIKCNVLSGGASSWRRHVLEKITFDVANKLHFFEDIDYSERAMKFYGRKFYINTKAKMEHVTNQEERSDHYNIQKIKVIDTIIYYKKRNHYTLAKKDLSLLLLWRLTESIATSLYNKKFTPVRGFLSGLLEGFRKDCL